MHKLIESPVKLGKAGNSTLEGNVSDGIVRGQKQGLSVSHPGLLHIIRQSKAGDSLKLVGQIAAADKKFP